MKDVVKRGLGVGLLLALVWQGLVVHALSDRVLKLEVQRLVQENDEKVVGDIFKTDSRITALETQRSRDAKTLYAVNVLAALTAKLRNVQDCDGSKVKEGTVGEQAYLAMTNSGLCNPRASE